MGVAGWRKTARRQVSPLESQSLSLSLQVFV